MKGQEGREKGSAAESKEEEGPDLATCTSSHLYVKTYLYHVMVILGRT